MFPRHCAPRGVVAASSQSCTRRALACACVAPLRLRFCDGNPPSYPAKYVHGCACLSCSCYHGCSTPHQQEWQIAISIFRHKYLGEHRAATKEKVIFGVGSYGSEENGNMGKCYKFSIDTTDQFIIGQVPFVSVRRVYWLSATPTSRSSTVQTMRKMYKTVFGLIRGKPLAAKHVTFIAI